MIDEEEILQLLSDIESARVERTVSTNDTDKFSKAICAFSNDLPNYRKNGYLILGARDNGELSGLQVTNQLLRNLSAIRTDGNIIPPPIIKSVTKYALDGGELAVVEVAPHFQPPVRYKGRVWIRNGPRKAIANEGEERILSEKRSSFARSFEAEPCHQSTMDDIHVELFKLAYHPHAIDEQTLTNNHRDLKIQLASLKFFDLVADKPTNAGIILFGKNPLFFFPGAYTQYVKFDGLDETGSIEISEEISGDLVNQLRDLDALVKFQIVKKKLVPISSLREKTITNYPNWALRELLLNAVIHRDYQSTTPIRIYQFKDRVEISNPGGLFGDARPENFPNINSYRNPELASAVKNLGYVNKFNIGVKRAIKLLKDNGNPEPLFIKDELQYFAVKIYDKN